MAKFRVTRKVFLHSGVKGNDRGDVYYPGDLVDLPEGVHINEKCLEPVGQVVRRVTIPEVAEAPPAATKVDGDEAKELRDTEKAAALEAAEEEKLSPQQKAARTRAANKAAQEAQE